MLPAVLVSSLLVADVTVIHNAKVITVDAQFSIAEGVVIDGDKITHVGSNAECLKHAGASAKRIDAGGRVVMPGLYDSHTHAMGACTSEMHERPPVYESLEQVTKFIAAETKRKPAGEWISIGQAFPTRLKEMRLPTRAELDAVAPEHPVVWVAYPLAVVNTAGLKRSGITKDTPDPRNLILRDPDSGEPTGVVRETGVLKGLPGSKPISAAEHREALKGLLARYNEYGLTAIAERGGGTDNLKLFRDLARTGELSVRVNQTRSTSAGPAERSAEACRKKLAALVTDKNDGPTGAGDDWVRVGPLKVMMDGGMLSGTAYMREPWGTGPTYQITDPTYRGMLRSDLEGARTLFTEAAKLGWQLTAHVAGEAAIDELLAIYRHIQNSGIDIRNRRMLLTHANFPSPEALKTCRELGVVADVQPAWFYLDGDSLARTLGPKRLRQFIPLKDWLEFTVAGGGSDHMTRLDADTSTNPWNPWLGMWIAMRRMTQFGNVLVPEQCLSREQAIRFYTINNAYLHFQEKVIGSLEPGKYADLIIIDRDILTCPVDDVRKTRVQLTMVGGKVRFERK